MKWVARILGGLLAVIIVAAIALYVASNRAINAKHTFREYAVAIPSDSASLAQGEHIARLSCFGCHGDSLQGQVFFDQPGIARLIAPNAVEKIAGLSDAELAGFMRSGVRKDGTSSFVMPPVGFYHISDQDLASLIAYLRTLPRAATPADLPSNSYGPMGRLGMAMGQFKTVAVLMDTTHERVGADPAWATSRHGEYLARVICSNCHGVTLTGDPATPSPSIANAAGYSAEEFTTLLRTGTPRDTATKLTLMGDVARAELRHLTDGEIQSVYGFLKALPPAGVR